MKYQIPTKNEPRKSITFDHNTGYLIAKYITDSTKPCFSVQHVLPNGIPGETQVTFTDSENEFERTVTDLKNRYDIPAPKPDIKINYNDLVLEITRRCNMNCAHCMRGDPQNIDMPFEIAKQAIDSAEEISSLTLTGGEPTLNLDLMEQIIDYIVETQIPLYNFYIVTNGKEVSDRFLKILSKYWIYTCRFPNKTYSAIALSRDEYHEPIPEENIWKLKMFSFYSEDKDGIEHDYIKHIINIGRAENIKSDYKHNRYFTTRIDYNRVDNVIHTTDPIYIAHNGDIITDCDLSYEKMPDFVYGNITEYDKFIERLLKEEE